MSKSTKAWIITAAILLLIGGVVFTGTMAHLEWDFGMLSTNEYETATYEITEDFLSISINTDTEDIRILPSEDAKASVVCYSPKNIKHSVGVENDKLSIKTVDTRKWYEYINIDFSSPQITVYLPKGDYDALLVNSHTGDLEISDDFRFVSIEISESTGNITNYASVSEFIKIRASTGSICIKDISVGSLDISVSTGRVTVSNVASAGDIKINVTTGKTHMSNITCKSIMSSGSTGDIYLDSVVVTEKAYIQRSTGDVSFESFDAAEIFIKTDTGDVEGELLSAKVFIAKTDTGKINVPSTATGGRCEISTDTGDIRITVSNG